MLLYLYVKSLYGFTFSWGEKGKVGSESTPFYERESDPTFPLLGDRTRQNVKRNSATGGRRTRVPENSSELADRAARFLPLPASRGNGSWRRRSTRRPRRASSAP